MSLIKHKRESSAEGASPTELYLERLDEFCRTYLQLVIFIGCVEGIAIVIAVCASVLLGAALAILAAAVYAFIVPDELYKLLGLRYKNENGHITVSRAIAKHGNELVIPSRLMLADVTVIADNAFSSPNGELKRIFLPRSITHIGKNVLPSDGSVSELCYEGTREEWDKITVETDLSGITLVLEAAYPTLPPRQRKKKAKGASATEAAEETE